MANENSRIFQELTTGTTVSFKLRSTGDRIRGSVYYFWPQSNGSLFGIKDGVVRKMDGSYVPLLGYNRFNLNDITELQVKRQNPNPQELQVYVVPRQNPNPQDAQNNNRDDGASSKSLESKMGSLCLDPPSK